MILERKIGENEEIPVDEYLEDVLLVGVGVGKAPTSTEYEELGRFSETSGRRKFGTWDNTLGVLCSEVFNMKIPYSEMIRISDGVDGITDMDVNEFRNKVGFTCNHHEWRAIREDLGVDDREEELSREEAIEDFKKYKEHWYNGNNRGFISEMSRILKTPPQEYIRHFNTVHEAEVLERHMEHYNQLDGRGSREKLDDLLKQVDEYVCVNRKPNKWLYNRVGDVQEFLPERFFENKIRI